MNEYVTHETVFHMNQLTKCLYMSSIRKSHEVKYQLSFAELMHSTIRIFSTVTTRNGTAFLYLILSTEKDAQPKN